VNDLYCGDRSECKKKLEMDNSGYINVICIIIIVAFFLYIGYYIIKKRMKMQKKERAFG
jgi:general stress protein CsbA